MPAHPAKGPRHRVDAWRRLAGLTRRCCLDARIQVCGYDPDLHAPVPGVLAPGATGAGAIDGFCFHNLTPMRPASPASHIERDCGTPHRFRVSHVPVSSVTCPGFLCHYRSRTGCLCHLPRFRLTLALVSCVTCSGFLCHFRRRTGCLCHSHRFQVSLVLVSGVTSSVTPPPCAHRPALRAARPWP